MRVANITYKALSGLGTKSISFLCFLPQNLTCPNGTVSNSTANGTGACVDGLGMTPQEYNLLYAIYAWT